MKKLLSLLSLFLTITITTAQNNTVLSIDGKPIALEEFEYYFNKNNTDTFQQNMSANEYMELFVNFKLKVHEASIQKMDTAQSFQQELDGYRKQLIKPYLTDGDKIDELVKEAYQHLLQDVNVSHILIQLSPNPSPSDTLAAFQKATLAYNRLTKGESFESVALALSEDPSVKENKGNLGFITGMMVVYPFEEAAYTTPVGQFSAPVRTRFGYHIIKVHEKRPTAGERLVAHILKRVPEDASEKQKAAIERSLQGIYDELALGADFKRLAQANSEDQSSARNGGEIDWTGTGKTTPEFEKAVFGLQEIGDVSAPVRTEYGWHIIQLLDKRDIMSLEKAYPLIEPRVKTDERAIIIANSFIAKLKTAYDFKSYPENLKALQTLATNPTSDLLAKREKYTLPVYTFADQTVSQLDILNYAFAQSEKDSSFDASVLNNAAQNLANIKLVEYENSQLETKYPEFGLLMREYKDGILLFDISNEMVWSKASKDTEGLSAFFDKNKEKYAWETPRFKGVIVYCDTKETYKAAEKLAKKTPQKDLSIKLKQTFNLTEKATIKVENGLFAKGTHSVVDKLAFKTGELPENKEFPYVFIEGDIQKKYPSSYQDIRGIVTNDYQNYLDKQWIESLRSKYTVEVNKTLLNSLPTDAQ